MRGGGHAVTAGVRYKFSVWTKAAAVPAPVQLVIGWWNDSGEDLNHMFVSPVVTNTTTGWSELTATVIAPVGANTARVGFQFAQTGIGRVHFFDDYTVTTTNETVTLTSVASKGFESTVDSMSVVSAATVSSSTVQARTGTRSLAIVPSGAWSVTEAGPGTTIDPALTYQLTGWARVSAGSAAALRSGVRWYNSSGVELRFDDIAHTNSVIWRPFTTQHMTPPVGAVSARIVHSGDPIGGNTWYVDDVSLATVAVTAPQVPSSATTTTTVSSKSFDTAADGIQNYYNATVATTTPRRVRGPGRCRSPRQLTGSRRSRCGRVGR